jgi:hypothetical protein
MILKKVSTILWVVKILLDQNLPVRALKNRRFYATLNHHDRSDLGQYLGVSEAVGHLEILREMEKVKVTEREGIDLYSLQV